MATSGSWTTSRGSHLHLKLAWSRIETDVANNRSKIRLTLTLQQNGYGMWFSTSKTGKLHGQSFTYTGGFSGTGTKTLRTRDVWITHNSDGTKSQSFSASINLNINYEGSSLGTMSVSGTANIDAIPRASGLTAFSLSNTTLNSGTTNTVTYTLDRKSSSFSHNMTLKLGSKTILSWTDSGTGDRTRALTAAQVNSIIAGRPNHTSGTLTLTAQTKSGTKNIGSAASRTRNFTISSSVAPTASGMSVSIAGSGRDKTINTYVQSISKVSASFNSSAGYGATVSNRSIVVRRVSGGSNSQTISGASGTTTNPVTQSGTYEAIGTIRDSRGRTATSRTTFTVQAYTSPRINSFTAHRDKPSTTVRAAMNLTYSKIDTLNPTTITLIGKSGDGDTTSHRNNTGQTAGSLNTTQNITGQSDANSYTYTLTVTDSFGNKAEAVATVGTSFQEFTIARGQGIGVGKIHEEGSLDVAGEAYFSGQLYLRPPVDQNYAYPRFQMHSEDENGHSYLEWFGSDGNRKVYIGVPTGSANYVRINNAINDNIGRIDLGDQQLNLRNETATYNGVPVFTSGNEVLWTGAIYLQESQSITPSKSLSNCPTGWILVWSRYASGTAQNDNWSFTHIPRAFQQVRSGNGGIQANIGRDEGSMSKYIYVTNTTISGHSRNNTAPYNTRVLRYVLSY